MSYLVLARKWRPQTFRDLIGQEHVSQTLKNAIDSGRVAHAFLFTGGRGMGKTSAARILAKALNCEHGPAAERQIRKIEAKGGVVVLQKDQNATGDSATFSMRENTVTLVGNVVVTHGQDVLRGHRLVVDLTSGITKMDQGRVEGLFQSSARKEPEKK